METGPLRTLTSDRVVVFLHRFHANSIQPELCSAFIALSVLKSSASVGMAHYRGEPRCALHLVQILTPRTGQAGYLSRKTDFYLSVWQKKSTCLDVTRPHFATKSAKALWAGAQTRQKDHVGSVTSNASERLPLSVHQQLTPPPPGDRSPGRSPGATLQNRLASSLNHCGLLHGSLGEIRRRCWGADRSNSCASAENDKCITSNHGNFVSPLNGLIV